MQVSFAIVTLQVGITISIEEPDYQNFTVY